MFVAQCSPDPISALILGDVIKRNWLRNASVFPVTDFDDILPWA